MANYLKTELYELIKKDESIFDFIHEGSLDGLWYWDLEKPENEWMNRRFWEVLGYNPSEMPHKASAWQNIINQDDLKLTIDNFQKHIADSNHPYDQEVRYTHKNGSIVWVRCRGMAIRNENGKAVRMLGTHQNITTNKYSEQFLKNTEVLEMGEEIAELGYFERNWQTGKGFWSKGFYLLLGENEMSVNCTHADFINYVHKDDVERVKKHIKLSIQNKSSLNIKFQLVQANNQIIQIHGKGRNNYDCNGKILSTIGTFRNITLEHSLNLELQKREQKFSLLFNESPSAIYETDANGKCLIVNKQWQKISGLSNEEALGDKWINGIHKDDRQKIYNNWNKFAKTGNSWSQEFRFCNKKGVITWVYGIATPLINEFNEIIGYIGTNIDITERMIAQEQTSIQELNATNLN